MPWDDAGSTGYGVRRGGSVWFHRRRRVIGGALAFALVVVLAACGGPYGLEEETSVELVVTSGSASTSGTDVETSVVSGEAFIVAETRPVATRVAFYIDDVELVGEPVKVDEEAPFEVVVDTRVLADGEHTVSAVVVYERKRSESTSVVTESFVVQNGVPPSDPADEPIGDPGDGSGDDPVGEPEPVPGVTDPSATTDYTLRADASFDISQLGADQGLWYRRVWAAIENPDARYALGSLAASGDLHTYAYDYNQQLSLLIAALRATQDPMLVDLIADLADRMADRLVTDWYDYASNAWVRPNDGTAGFRRFLYYKSSNATYGGKDTQVLRSLLAHGLIANMAYVFEANRDVASPSGVDYGARADFWTDYLKNDFEAIWRIREGAAWPAFPLWTHPVAHAWKSQMRWAFYMYKLTGEQPYLDSAADYADTVLRRTFAVDTPIGSAVVWSHKLTSPDYGLQPFAYARLDYAVEVDLALEGGLDGIDAEYMAMHARTLAHFLLDNGSTDVSFDVGGMRDRTGVSLRGGSTATVPTKDPWTGSSLEYRRESAKRLAISYVAPVAVFGEQQHILGVVEDMYASLEPSLENPEMLSIPVGMVLALR